MTSEAPAAEPENQDSVFGRGYMMFLGVAGGLFVIIAVAIPMVIIASALTQGSTAAPPVTSGVDPGEALASSAGCLACHTTDGTDLVGPSWQAIAGAERQLESGDVVTADDDYLNESIVDPRAKIVAGFQPVMPEGYGDQLTEEEISTLVEYIKTLG